MLDFFDDVKEDVKITNKIYKTDEFGKNVATETINIVKAVVTNKSRRVSTNQDTVEFIKLLKVSVPLSTEACKGDDIEVRGSLYRIADEPALFREHKLIEVIISV